MRHLLLRISLVAFILAVLILSGCSRDTSENSGRLSIAVIPKGSTHEFWKSIHLGANRAGSELGVDVIWKGPLKEDDREQQIKIVEDFVTRGVSGIVLAPLDDKALRPSVVEAKRARIPTVIMDSGLQGGDYVSFVATDNRLGGKMAGEYLGKLLGGKGRVVVLRYMEGSESTRNREEGFLDAMKSFPEITMVSSNQYAGPTTETAYQASENILNSHKDGDVVAIDGIFTPCESATFGMLRALEDAAIAGKIHFVGFDSSQKILNAISDGKLDGVIVQNPQMMGYLGVKTMVQYLHNEAINQVVDTGAHLVTKDSMNSEELQSILHPDLSGL